MPSEVTTGRKGIRRGIRRLPRTRREELTRTKRHGPLGLEQNVDDRLLGPDALADVVHGLKQTDIALDEFECVTGPQGPTLGQDARRIRLGTTDDVGARATGVFGKRLDRVLADAARATDKHSNEALREIRGNTLIGGNSLGKSDHFGRVCWKGYEREGER